ncbi:MAG: PcfJ domain-containing protein [Planctomycetota bacterium]
MPVTHPKAQRVKRWERKQKQGERDRRLQKLLKEKKQAKKAERGPALILKHATKKLTNARYLAAVDELWDAARRSKLAEPDRTRAGWPEASATYLFALAQLAQRHESWVRRPNTWDVRTHNADRQFASLARHLLCDYAVPGCFESAWFNPAKSAARKEQSWYIRLGRGESLRTAKGLPCELTRKAAHFVARAPDRLTIRQAFRWGQLRAMDADPALIDALLASAVGTDFKRDGFWLTVVRFFVNHPMLDRAQVGPIVDYLHHQRYTNQPAMLIDGRVVEPGPAQPNLSMRGRSPEALLRQVRRWHGRLARLNDHATPRHWRSCGVPGLTRVEGDGPKAVLWGLQELCDSRELIAEGRRMRHCVATYVSSCARGFVGIYSMTRTQGSEIKPVLTVEVKVAERQIVQARGKDNVRATPDQMRVLGIWAQEAGLKVMPYV